MSGLIVVGSLVVTRCLAHGPPCRKASHFSIKKVFACFLTKLVQLQRCLFVVVGQGRCHAYLK